MSSKDRRHVEIQAWNSSEKFEGVDPGGWGGRLVPPIFGMGGRISNSPPPPFFYMFNEILLFRNAKTEFPDSCSVIN